MHVLTEDAEKWAAWFPADRWGPCAAAVIAQRRLERAIRRAGRLPIGPITLGIGDCSDFPFGPPNGKHVALAEVRCLPLLEGVQIGIEDLPCMS